MTAPEQATLGALLKQRREQRGLTLEKVAGLTRIKLAYLQALEEDRFEVFPGEVYLSGFLRTYAGLLDLDAKALLERYREQSGAGRTQAAEALTTHLASVPVEAVPRRSPLGVILMLVVVISVLAVVGAVLLFKPLGAPATTATAPAAPTVEPPAPAAPPEQVPQAVEAGPSVEAADPQNASGQVPASLQKPGPSVAEPPVEPAAPTPVFHQPRESEAPPAAHEQPLPQIKAGGAAMKVEALAPVSIGIIVDSQPLRRYDLPAATVLRWKVRSQVRLTVSDPASLKIWLDQEMLELGNRSELFLQDSSGAQNEDG